MPPRPSAAQAKAGGGGRGKGGGKGAAGSSKPSQPQVAYFLDLDLEELRDRHTEAVQAINFKKVEARGNLRYDAGTGRAALVRELKFKVKLYSASGHCDDPKGEWDTDPRAMRDAEALAVDLAQMYKASPCNLQIVRFIKRHADTRVSKEREKWTQELHESQGECLKRLLARNGVPAGQILVSAEIPPAGTDTRGGCHIYFESEQNRVDTAVHKVFEKIALVTQNGNVAFDDRTGRVSMVKDLMWNPRGDGFMFPDEAEEVLKDLFEAWYCMSVKCRGITASIVAELLGDSADMAAVREIAVRRGSWLKEALEKIGIPRECLQLVVPFGEDDRDQPPQQLMPPQLDSNSSPSRTPALSNFSELPADSRHNRFASASSADPYSNTMGSAAGMQMQMQSEAEAYEMMRAEQEMEEERRIRAILATSSAMATKTMRQAAAADAKDFRFVEIVLMAAREVLEQQRRDGQFHRLFDEVERNYTKLEQQQNRCKAWRKLINTPLHTQEKNPFQRKQPSYARQQASASGRRSPDPRPPPGDDFDDGRYVRQASPIGYRQEMPPYDDRQRGGYPYNGGGGGGGGAMSRDRSPRSSGMSQQQFQQRPPPGGEPGGGDPRIRQRRSVLAEVDDEGDDEDMF